MSGKNGISSKFVFLFGVMLGERCIRMAVNVSGILQRKVISEAEVRTGVQLDLVVMIT